MADLDAKIRALEEQVAREAAELDRARRMPPAGGPMGGSDASVGPSGGGVGGGEKGAPRFAKDADERSIFVGNLPRRDETPEELAAFFSECGPVLKCTILRDRATGALKGQAYVEFATHEAAGRAVDMRQNAIFNGQPLHLSKKRSMFNPARARGGAGGAPIRGGRGGGGTEAVVAQMANMMGMMMGMMMQGGRGGGGFGDRGGFRGGARGGGFPGGRGGAGGPPAGGFRPFQ